MYIHTHLHIKNMRQAAIRRSRPSVISLDQMPNGDQLGIDTDNQLYDMAMYIDITYEYRYHSHRKKYFEMI